MRTAAAPAELLQPTLQDVVAVRDLGPRAPWRIQPQILVAFFGGVLSATAIAVLNARRLGLDAAAQRRMAAVGAVGFGVAVLASAAVSQAPLPAGLPALMTTAWVIRRVRQAVALLTWWPLARLQRSGVRRWQARVDDAEHSSLWLGGLLAVVALGMVEAVAFVACLAVLGVHLETLAL